MRFKTTITGLLAVIAATLALDALNLLAPLDHRLLDTEFRLLTQWFPQPAAREIVVVGVDDETTKRLPEPITLWHRHLSKFLAAMAQVKPSAVGVDIILPDRSFDAVLPGSDKLLIKGILEARHRYPLVLGLTVDPLGKLRAIHPPFLALAGPQGAGYALLPIDGDGHVRRFDERLGTSGEQVPTLAGQIARALGVEPRAGLIDYWRGAPFAYIPLQQVLQWVDDGDQRSLEQAFRGKPVLLGMVLPFTDRTPVPVTLAAWEPGARDASGVLLHAQALRSMLGSGLIRPVPRPAVAAAAAAAALLWFVSGSSVLIGLVFCAIAMLFFAASTWLTTQGWFFPAAAPVLSAALALGGRNALDTLAKLRERRRLRGSFSGYVSPSVMDEILAGRIQPELGGTGKFVCVMFSDIRGYTTRSEGMTPEQVIRFLNRYFEEVVALIHARGGSVVSFMGDGIMAVFGAPKPLDNPCREAFEAARAMSRYVASLNEQFRAEGVAPMEIGIGLHAGEAVIGHVGSSTRHDYTAIGDVTNVASRLEGLTKEAGYRIVVSRIVAEHLGEGHDLKPLGPMAIKGHTPVEVHGFDKI